MFWIIAAALSASALAMLLPALLGRNRATPSNSRAQRNAEVYRAELDELDRSLTRGALSSDQHRLDVDELMRRVLDEHSGEPAISRPRSWGAALTLLVAVPAVAFAVYLQVGNPAAAGDEAPAAEGTPAVAALERHLARSPADARAWVFLARRQLELDRFSAAAQSYERALAASGKVARDPQVWCELADALAMAQGGSLEGRPKKLIERALAIDPGHPRALEMAGSAAIESADYASALAYWDRLSKQLPADSPGRAELQPALERLRALERDL